MKKALTRSALLSLCCLGLLASLAAAEGTKRLSLDMFLDMERVSSPRISPDGSQIIYTRSWVNKMEDRWESAIWIMNSDGSKNRFLVKGSNAHWSPSGDRIAFTSRGEPKGSQIYIRWMDDEGTISQVSRLTQSPRNLKWSPDGKSIAFEMMVEKRNTWSVKMPKKPAGAKWVTTPHIVERMHYRRDRVGFIDHGYQHIFVIPADRGTPRQLTEGDYNHRGIHWTPDGKKLLFTSLRVEDAEYHWRESEIYSVDVASKDIQQLTRRRGPDSNGIPSPDGRHIAYTGYDFTDDTYITQKIYLMNADGSNPRMISGNWDRSPRGLTWSPDSRTLFFSIRSEGTSNLYKLPINGSVSPVTSGTHMLNVSHINDRGQVVGTLSSAQKSGDVVSFDLNRPSSMRQLTRVNDDIFEGVTFGDLHELRYQSADGLEIQGWYVTPPDFDPSRKYKMQMHIHGGPHGMYHTGFNFGWQEQAANDYVILYTNPRGSSGYGSAFGNMIKNAYPSKDYDDLMAGVDALIAKGFIDEQNMNVTGCSGGGVLTAWVVGHTDRFAAASSNCPVVDWVSFVGTTDGSSWYRNFKKLPWDDPSEHLKRSPLMYVGNVKTPTMLMTGVKDLRTPMPQTEQYYSALKLLKVPTAMVRFNEEWHGTGSRPSNFMRTQLYLRHWFERHARPTSAGEIATPDEN